jgi:hypothetical protein
MWSKENSRCRDRGYLNRVLIRGFIQPKEELDPDTEDPRSTLGYYVAWKGAGHTGEVGSSSTALSGNLVPNIELEMEQDMALNLAKNLCVRQIPRHKKQQNYEVFSAASHATWT